MARSIYCFVILLGLGFGQLSAQGILNKTLSINIKQQPLEETLFMLMDQADVDLSFSNDIIPAKTVTLQVKNQSLKNVLDWLLRGTNIRYRLVRDQVVLFKSPLNQEKRYTISGFVEDAQTGERLIGVTIYDTYSRKGTTTNAYGFYSLTLDSDKVALKYSYVGYLLQSYNADLIENIRIDISLQETVTQLATITIASDSLNPETGIGTNMHEMNNETLANLPGFGGERDIIRSIHLLPGVQTGTDGIGGISVRGGSPDENLILIDDVPVYNFTHGAGLYSILNSDAVQKATLYKSEFPARFNGRLSSILDIRTKDGNKKELKGSVGINLLGFKGSLEGPIVRGQSSFFISARRSFVNWFLTGLSRAEKERNGQDGQTTYDFHDLNIKLNHAFSPSNRLFLSVYSGQDDYDDNGSEQESWTDKKYYADVSVDKSYQNRVKWSNTTASLRWNTIIGNQLFANTTLIYSNLDVRNHDLTQEISEFNFERINRRIEQQEIFGSTFSSSIRDFGAKVDLQYLPSPKHNLRAGAFFTHHIFQPGAFTFDQENYHLADSDAQLFGNSAAEADESGIYLEDEIEISPNLRINAGFTYVNWQISSKTYQSLQSRFSLAWQLEKGLSFTLGYSRMEQFIHRLFRSTLGLPSDLWVPSTANIGPRNADIFSLGLNLVLKPNAVVNIGTYYKKLNNLIEYSEGANFINNWEDNVTVGKGSAYGVELLYNQMVGRTSLQFAYALGFSNRQFDNINFGRTYPYRFDRRHNANINLNHQFNKWLDFSGSWIFNTGFAFSVPRQQYYIAIYNAQQDDVILQNVLDYGEKNDFRMPAYHRLDLNLRGKWETGKVQHALSFGVYNAYNRKNPLYYRVEKEPTIIDDRVIINSNYVEAWLMPVVPHVDYSIGF